MTSLDQAFIRAYQGRGGSAAPSSVLELDPPVRLYAPPEEPEQKRGHSTFLPASSLDEHPAPTTSPSPEPQQDFPRLTGPMLQVDGLTWPEVCNRLEGAARHQLDSVAESLASGALLGRKLVAVCGHAQGDGCTTVLLSVARRLVERGLSVVMVDADLGNPELARSLDLLPEMGWEHAVGGLLPLAEVLVESIADRVVVLPWCGPRTTGGETMLSDPPQPGVLEPLRAQYDLVLVDLGAISGGADPQGSPLPGIGDWLDAALVVHHTGRTRQQELARTQAYLAAAGMFQIGVVENFVADQLPSKGLSQFSPAATAQNPGNAAAVVGDDRRKWDCPS